MSAPRAAVVAPPIDAADVDLNLHDMAVAGLAWVEHHWVRIAVALAIGAAIVFVLLSLREIGRKLCDRGGRLEWPAVFGRAIGKTNLFFMVTLAAELVNGYADAPAAVDQTISFLFTIGAVFQGAVWARALILGGIEHRTQGDGASSEALGSAMGIIQLLVTLALFSVALIVVLDNLGVNVTGLVAGLGVGGIAIGLAAQGIFADLFAALAIIFDRPFRKGDAITYGQSSGTVEEIGIKSTRVRSTTGEERIISNKNLLNLEIHNDTRRDRRRVTFKLRLIYQTPVAVADGLPVMLKDIVEGAGAEFIRSGFVNFGESSLDFEVEFDSRHADHQSAYDARHAIGLAILKRFNDAGIKFAYPTQTSFAAAPDGRAILPYPDGGGMTQSI